MKFSALALSAAILASTATGFVARAPRFAVQVRSLGSNFPGLVVRYGRLLFDVRVLNGCAHSFFALPLSSPFLVADRNMLH